MSDLLNFSDAEEQMEYLEARALIETAIEAEDRPFGVIPCPRCGSGMLRFKKGFRGALRAQCSSLHCIHWIEPR